MTPSIVKLELKCDNTDNFEALEQLPLLEEAKFMDIQYFDLKALKFVSKAQYLKKLILNGYIFANFLNG